MINRKNSLARRYSGALLLLTVTSLLIACSGAESASGSSTTATASNTATLTWDALPLADISGYRVYYGTTRGPVRQTSWRLPEDLECYRETCVPTRQVDLLTGA